MMNLNNIPQEIQSLDQWVCARASGKEPRCASNFAPASTTAPATWRTFDTAKNAVVLGKHDYVGFVFNHNGIVGIDVDTGFDEDGFLTELAVDIITTCKSYTEKSRSGRGFHILLKGDLPFNGKNNLKGVEIYKAARYFIMTGDVLLYDKIIENQEAIDYIVEKYFPETRAKGDSSERVYDSRIYNPLWEKSSSYDKIKLRPVYPRIPDGSRNICLTSLAGVLHNQGYSFQQIYDELLYCNKVACDPMLPNGELLTIVKSVTRYKR